MTRLRLIGRFPLCDCLESKGRTVQRFASQSAFLMKEGTPGTTPFDEHWLRLPAPGQDPEGWRGYKHVSNSCTAADRTKSGSQRYSGSRYPKVSALEALFAL